MLYAELSRNVCHSRLRVDGSLGLLVLGEAAKTSMLCLQALMSLQTRQRHESGSVVEKVMPVQVLCLTALCDQLVLSRLTSGGARAFA